MWRKKSGWSDSNVAGLSFGMVLVGAVLGSAVVVFFGRLTIPVKLKNTTVASVRRFDARVFVCKGEGPRVRLFCLFKDSQTPYKKTSNSSSSSSSSNQSARKDVHQDDDFFFYGGR